MLNRIKSLLNAPTELVDEFSLRIDQHSRCNTYKRGIKLLAIVGLNTKVLRERYGMWVKIKVILYTYWEWSRRWQNRWWESKGRCRGMIASYICRKLSPICYIARVGYVLRPFPNSTAILDRIQIRCTHDQSCLQFLKFNEFHRLFSYIKFIKSSDSL